MQDNIEDTCNAKQQDYEYSREFDGDSCVKYKNECNVNDISISLAGGGEEIALVLVFCKPWTSSNRLCIKALVMFSHTGST